jgi:polar amino acid transport system permease protein
MLDFDFIRDNWLFIATGIGATLGVTFFSFLLAAPVAAIVAIGRRSTFLPIKALFSIYVLFIDGIPLYLQIFFIFLALPQLGIILPGFGAALLVLSVNYSSRISEVFYRLFTTEGKSQDKNLFSWIPPFANEFNNIIKDSALLAATGFIHEVMWRAVKVGRAEFKPLEALIIAAVIYLILITGITLGAKVLKLITTPKASTETAS